MCRLFFGQLLPTNLNSSWRILEFWGFLLEFFWGFLEFFRDFPWVFMFFFRIFGCNRKSWTQIHEISTFFITKFIFCTNYDEKWFHFCIFSENFPTIRKYSLVRVGRSLSFWQNFLEFFFWNLEFFRPWIFLKRPKKAWLNSR